MKHKKSLSFFLVAVLTLFLLLAGCMGRKYVEKRTFLLDVSRNGAVSPSESNGVLRVRTLRVSPQYENKGFVYRTGDMSYRSDFYNEFFTSPDSMITEKVREWLAGSGLFQNVVDFSGQVEPTHILEGEVIDLYGDYARGTQPRAVLAIGLLLLHDVSGRSEIVLQKRYRKEVPLKGDSPEDLVEGWTKALRQVLTDFERHLRETLSKSRHQQESARI